MSIYISFLNELYISVSSKHSKTQSSKVGIDTFLHSFFIVEASTYGQLRNIFEYVSVSILKKFN